MSEKKQTESYILSNGVTIPVVGYGTWQMQNGAETTNALLQAIEAGYRHIDTAAAYGNEESVGQAVRQSGIARRDLFLTSKLANPDHGYDATRLAFQRTLEKLDTDYLDLYLIHWPNPISARDRWREANAESWKAMEEFYEAGQIRAIGVSNFLPHHLEALFEQARIVPMVNQISLSIGQTQNEVCAYCRARGMLMEAYSPLGTGRVLQTPQMWDYAAKYKKTVAQVCIRWSLQMGFLPLPKATKAAHLRQNIDVFDFSLTQDDVKALMDLNCGGFVRDPDTIQF